MIQNRFALAARLSFVAAVVGCTAYGPAQAATNLLVNGGFETGDLSGWTVAGDTVGTGPQCSGAGSATVAEGICSAVLSTFTAGGTLSQSFATVSGASYVLSFSSLFGYLNHAPDAPSSFSATVAGQKVVDLTNPFVSTYQNFVVSFKAVSTSTTLAFAFRDDPGIEFLDNVSVVGAVPEPASAALLFAGLGVVAWRRRNAKT